MMAMQAKDIPDEVFIAAVQTCSRANAQRWGHDSAWCSRMEVEDELNALRGFPDDPFAPADTADTR